MDRVLITGSQGFIGRSMMEYLERKGYEVVGLDVGEGAGLRINILDSDALIAATKDAKPSHIIHLAAVSSPPACREDPQSCLKTNVLGTINALEAARLIGVERFIFLSSANVYGPRPATPVTEECPLAPRALYDHSKVIAEKCVEAYNRLYGLPTVVFRSWKVFGEFDSRNSAISRFIRACLEGGEIVLFNGGRDVTDPFHVENLCYASELALHSDDAVGQTFNVGTGNAISIKQLAVIIKNLTSSSATLREAPPRSPEEAEPMVSYPSIEKISRVLKYRPVVGLEEGLKRLITHWKTVLSS
ncbi:MAG: NAD-dependent epimerase/dehydratase family protein [Nitrososphaerota archaeon]